MPTYLLLLLWLRLLSPAAAPTIEERNFQPLFDQYGVQGSLLLYEAGRPNRYVAHDLARCRRGFLPASTFKIPNTLIGLQTGALPDTAQICKWDKVTRSFPQWNQDMSYGRALRVSCVPCYQQLARRIGLAAYQQWLPRLGYPGMVVTAATVDTFWLAGDSRITQFEQIAFLRRLQAEKLPVAARHQRAVTQLLRLGRAGSVTLYGKSGWTFSSATNTDNGWFVGWLERPKAAPVFFALNVDPKGGQADKRFAGSRRAIVELALVEMGWLPARLSP